MQKRIFISVVISILIMLASLGLISYLRVHESIERSYEERLATTEMIAGYIDRLLEANLTRLYDISLSGKIDFQDGDWGPERAALRDAYEYSIFTDGVFLLDRYGNVVQMYPYRENGMVNLLSIPAVSKALREMKPVISGMYTLEPTKKRVIFALVPLKNRYGEVVGAAGGEINPTNHLIAQLTTSSSPKKNTLIELVDDRGMIIASNDPGRVLTRSDHNRFLGTLIAERKSSVGTCHRCHGEEKSRTAMTRDILVFSSLSRAPWGVSMREPEESVFSPSTRLKKDFLVLGLVFLATAFMLALGLSRSIVKPVQLLIGAARRIGTGNLADPVEAYSKDEIGTLARSFDDMRVKLAESLAGIQLYNEELEQRVYERTKELEKKQIANKTLLKKVITSQEDERKRIARGLHDTILQDISAFLINLDICRLHPGSATVEKIDEMKKIATETIDNIHLVIKDLRPSIIDDLGLDAAIMWLLANHFHGKGVHYYLEMVSPIPARLPPAVKITLFRILQETIINIERHAHAENVFVVLDAKDASLDITIDDDGVGFDIDESMRQPMQDGKGLGILGMKERAALLDGTLHIHSTPGKGTRVRIEIPLKDQEEHV